jgi:hypothetical protein
VHTGLLGGYGAAFESKASTVVHEQQGSEDGEGSAVDELSTNDSEGVQWLEEKEGVRSCEVHHGAVNMPQLGLHLAKHRKTQMVSFGKCR